MVLNRDDPRFTDLDREESNTRVHEYCRPHTLSRKVCRSGFIVGMMT
jgi:hypothetical protein